MTKLWVEFPVRHSCQLRTSRFEITQKMHTLYIIVSPITEFILHTAVIPPESDPPAARSIRRVNVFLVCHHSHQLKISPSEEPAWSPRITMSVRRTTKNSRCYGRIRNKFSVRVILSPLWPSTASWSTLTVIARAQNRIKLRLYIRSCLVFFRRDPFRIIHYV